MFLGMVLRNGSSGKSLTLYFSGLKNPRSLESTPPPGPPDSEFLVQISVPTEKANNKHHAKIPLEKGSELVNQ